MSPESRTTSQEVPTKEFLAKEAKDLLVYAAQEGTPSDMKAFYDSLDIEKVLALVEVEGNDPTDLPREIVGQLLNDTRAVVKKALKDHPAFFQHAEFFTAKELTKAYGLSHEQIVANGRSAVAHVLARVANRELREEEVVAVSNMARNIPDARVIETLFPLAERNRKIALELAYNPGLNAAQANRLVDVALGKMAEDPDWSVVVMELIADPDRHGLLNPASLKKIQSDPELGRYLSLWNRPAKAAAKVIELPKSGSKRRHTPAERKARREEQR
ncbi:hypothetical protein HZA44_03120, partial [Candidatus Peregrinibacteria bacterium]|nr:hypothetical protein [Candidatus Peregrinibacteria bacterium]